MGMMMMSIEKIRAANVDELYSKIESVCENIGLHIRIDKTKSQVHISRAGKNSVLRIYSKKDGFKIDTSVGANKELNKEFEENFKDFKVTEAKDYSYRGLTESQFYEIKIELENIKNDYIDIIPRENKDPNKIDFFEVKDSRTNESVKIHMFKKGTLQLQGVVWNLWEDICEIIDLCKNSSVVDIIDRFLLGDSCYNDDEDYTDEINTVKDILTEETFDFLEEHFQDYLISAQCVLNSDCKMKEFSTVLCPTAKVVEGFLKQVLVKCNLEDSINIKGNWNFGCVIDNNKGNYFIKYKRGISKLPNKKEQAICDLYKVVKGYRHNLNHGSLRSSAIVVKEKANAKKMYEDMLIKIKESYYNILK